MIRPIAFALASLLATSAMAGEMVSGTNYYLTEVKQWKTGVWSGYWMFSSKGISEAKQGPLPTVPVECHGAGSWDAEKMWGNGICINGKGRDTWTLRWAVDEGQSFQSTAIDNYKRTGKWQVVSGSGKYAGMTGSGTYTSSDLPDNRRVTMWEGEVELAK